MNHLLRKNKISNLDHDVLKQDKSILNPGLVNANKDTSERIVIKVTDYEMRVQIYESKENYEEKDEKSIENQNEHLNGFMKIWIKIKNFYKYHFKNNERWIEVKDVFCDTSFKHADILIVIGILKIAIAICVLLIGIYAYLNNEKSHVLILAIGFCMFSLGVIVCLLRLIIFQPRILPFLCLDKKVKRKKINQNPACYSCLNAAMKTAFSIPLRYNRNNSIVDLSDVIKNKRKLLRSPKSATISIMFANKLLRKIKSSRLYSRISSSKLLRA